MESKDKVMTNGCLIVFDVDSAPSYTFGILSGHKILYVEVSDECDICFAGWDLVESVKKDIKGIFQVTDTKRFDICALTPKIVKNIRYGASFAEIARNLELIYWINEQEPKELTVADIEKFLGYKVKIVKG